MAVSRVALQATGIDFANVERTLRTDDAGRLKISHGQPTAITGTLSALNNRVSVVGDGFSDVIFYFTGTTVQTVTFEQSWNSTDGSDGTWFPVLAANQGAVSAASVTAAITSVHTYRVSAPAGSYISVRTSAFTSGASSVAAVTTTAMAQAQVTSSISGTIAANSTATFSATAGGYTTRFFNSSVTAKTAVKTSAGSVVKIAAYNPNSAPVWLQFFNTALASVTPGSTVPVESYMIPAATGSSPGSYVEIPYYYSRFTTAITIAPWSVAGNSAGVAPETGLVVNIGYV